MDRLFYMCQKIVEINTTLRDQDTIDLLAASILSLIINRGYDVLERIPSILKNTIIISDDRSVLDVQHQVINNYKEDKELKNATACVTRRFSFKDNKYNEERYMIIPKKSIKREPIATIEKTTHELIHLLRFREATRSNDSLVFVEGIATKTIDLKTGTTYRRCHTLEETIVQKTAKSAVEDLLEYSKELSFNPMFQRIDRDKHNYHSNIYEPHVKFFDQLLLDSEFKRLVDDTFTSYSSRPLANYYNGVMDDNTAFSQLSNYFNKMDAAIDEDNVPNAKKYACAIRDEILRFKKHKKVKSLY